MAAVSPIVGKNMFWFGRRNMCRWGMVTVALPFLGFYLTNFIQDGTTFVIVFMLMRFLQGVGTSMVQTSAYAILTLTYPTQVNFVVGCIETAAGVGLSFGPVIGTILYEIGGVSLPFLAFFVLCLLIGIIIKSIIPETVDSITEDTHDEGEAELSYYKLLKDRRIFFANCCVFLAVFQYAFIDPLLANYMHKAFAVGYHISGYFFLSIGVGYTISCLLVHVTLKRMSNMRVAIISCILLGVFTMMYSSSNILHLPKNMLLLAGAMFLAGIVNAHMVIPPMDEMLNVGQEKVIVAYLIRYSSG
jgi:MFS family permease